MLGETLFANKHDARPLMSRRVARYFIVLLVLTLISLIPGAILIGLVLLVVPGLILIASGTLLYYSVAALPGYFIDRFFAMRLLAIAVAAFNVFAAATLPHAIGKYLLDRLVAADHADPPTSLQPLSFELPYPERANDWANARRPESRSTNPPPPCADLCQQLLFKGHVDEVVIRDRSDPLGDGRMAITGMKAFRINPDGSTQPLAPAATAPNPAEFFKPKWRRFHLERHEACADTWSLVEGAFVHEVVGGRCLVEDTVERTDADVVLSVVKADGQDDPLWTVASSMVQTGPTTVTLAERRDHRAIPVETKTALEAHYPTAPFYVSAGWWGGSSLAVATDPFQRSADPVAMIARRYGFALAPTLFATRFVVPVADGDRAAVVAILAQDYGAGGYIPMAPSRLVESFVNALLRRRQLDADDIALIRALLKQRAFVLPIDAILLPRTYQALKPLLPDMFERIAYRADGQSDMVQSLNVILDSYSAEDTDPYSSALCDDRKNAGLRVCYKREFRNSHKK